jgi:hypothetical protein
MAVSRRVPVKQRSQIVVSVFALVLSACGVQQMKQPQRAGNSSNDFGPNAGAAGSTATGSNRVSTPVNMMTGTPVSMVGRSGGAGVGGSLTGMAGMTSVTTPVNGMLDAGMLPPVMPPVSGVTLEIGGTTVAKENAIAFIHFGHSNMAGRAIGPTATRPYFFTETDPHAWMYHVGQPLALAQEPYTAEDNTSGTYGGPGTALVKEAAALAPDKYFISLGYGKESAYCSQFLPGSLYYDSVMKAPLAIKDRVTFGAIVILLGITERHGTSADITGYSSCINQLVTAVRKDVGVPDLPLLICDYEQEATGLLAVGQAFPTSIIPEIHKIPMVVSNSALVPTDGLGMQDDHHFNFDGHKLYIQRLLQIMKDRGWFPWAK